MIEGQLDTIMVSFPNKSPWWLGLKLIARSTRKPQNHLTFEQRHKIAHPSFNWQAIYFPNLWSWVDDNIWETRKNLEGLRVPICLRQGLNNYWFHWELDEKLVRYSCGKELYLPLVPVFSRQTFSQCLTLFKFRHFVQPQMRDWGGSAFLWNALAFLFRFLMELHWDIFICFLFFSETS